MQSRVRDHIADLCHSNLRRSAIILCAAWTALIAASLFWNLYVIHKDSIEKARVEARTILEHNIAYRRWNSKFGGVYAPVGPDLQPNPFIISPRRDLTAINGIKLTLINPFQMTKQTYALLREQNALSAVNRTVSLNPMNLENEPDAWEAKALREFEKGAGEVSEVTAINGQPYARVLRPYITYKPCLECHASQGYKVGDIRGGMSIAVPLAPYLTAEIPTRRTVVGTHAAIWIAGMIGIGVLMAAIRRHQIQTAESEWKFRILSDNAQDWQYWISQNGDIVHMTPSCERITGYTADEFRRSPALAHDIIYPEDRPSYERHMQEDFTKPAHEEIDFRIVTRSGNVKRIFHVCGPIHHQGRLLGRHVSNRDVTDRKQLEEQLMQAQKMESLGLFAGGIAHDFNNILTVITGYGTMLQKQLASADEDIRKQLQDVVSASLKARSLVSSLLAFGRKQVMRRAPVSVNNIISNITSILKRIIGEDIHLVIRCSPIELPVDADMHQVEQVLMNLMTNARDAMPGGGNMFVSTDHIVIDHTSADRFGAEPGKYMVLTVRDEGSGIDKNDLEHIFEPFFTTKKKGSGLGLAMVYGIVKQHEGFIQVESKKGAGTTVRIYFPAARQFNVKEDGSTRTADVARGTESILLIEDDDMVRTFLQNVLQANGYTVIPVREGESALAQLRSGNTRIDAAIIDLVLPGMNGRDVYEEARRLKAGFRAAFISGYGPEELETRGLRTENMILIQKPIDIEKFLSALRELFSLSAEKTAVGYQITNPNSTL